MGLDGIKSGPVLAQQVVNVLESKTAVFGQRWECWAVVESTQDAQVQELVVGQMQVQENSLLGDIAKSLLHKVDGGHDAIHVKHQQL